MQKEEVHILIVDDDASLGKGMAEFLKRAGFKVTHVLKPDDALALIKLQTVHVAIIDCMLPKINGRDLAKQIKESAESEIIFILISGIYKDKSYARDAMKTTGAVAFIAKPFEMPEFLTKIEEATKQLIDAPLVRLQKFLAESDISAKERISAVDEADTIHAYELPWIYNLLMHPKVNGHLNIISADGDIAGVGFSNGEIVLVYQEDLKSYFGVLLVENGFIEQADLDQIMTNAKAAKKLGERLVEANALSPHAIEVVMAEQQGLRLSKTIDNTSVKINFVETDELKANAHTDKNGLAELVNEWLASKFSLNWLKSNYIPWLRYNFKKGPEWSTHHRIFSCAVVRRVPDVTRILLECDSLENAQEKLSGVSEDYFYRALHALIITRVLRFGEPGSAVDFSALLTRLQKLDKTLETQNFFERLGVSQKAQDSEIRRSYHELAKVLHPDKLAPGAPAEVRELAKRTFEKISTAYASLSNQASKEEYVLELKKGRAEAQMQADSLTDQARPLISVGNIKRARDLLEQAEKLAPMNTETRLLLIWAKLKSPGNNSDPRLLLKMKEEMSTIPPEDRYSNLFLFVRGLLMRANGERESARKTFENLLSQSPDFIEVRRELNSLNQEMSPQKTNILNGDLKDVVGMLFKKKR